MKKDYQKPQVEFLQFDVLDNITNDFDGPIAGDSGLDMEW